MVGVAAPAARIVIGASPLALSSQFTRTLADLRQTQPRLEVTVRVLGREAIPREVATATLDLGLIDGMAAPNDPLHLADRTEALQQHAGRSPSALPSVNGSPADGDGVSTVM
ncbi:MAG: LysR family transcriptional regulator [Actinomycetia bacterium]|nr:LysR family transcriptional regulator [Actinomycetes bacterium]